MDKLTISFIVFVIVVFAGLGLFIADKRNMPCYDLASSECLTYRMQQCEAADFSRQECLIIIRELP